MEDRIEALLQLVPALRGKAVRCVPLSGGLTNRNYRLDADGGPYVLRLGGPDTAPLGIDRAREAAWSRTAAAAGVGAEVIAFLPEHAALITRFLPGRVLSAEDIRRPAVLHRVVEAVRRVHDGPPGPGRFSAFATIRNYLALARGHAVSLPDGMERALGLMARIEQATRTGEPPCPCHNDLLPGNFIDDGTIVRIIDWEYAGMGDRFFDLGNLAANHGLDADQERALLAFSLGTVRPEHLRRLRLMRRASDLREALWGYLQAGISTLDYDFRAYGRTHLERFLAAGAGLDADLLETPARIGGPPS